MTRAVAVGDVLVRETGSGQGRESIISGCVVPDSSRPAARLDMRPAVVETPTVEADIVPGWLDRLTLISARTKGGMPLALVLSEW